MHWTHTGAEPPRRRKKKRRRREELLLVLQIDSFVISDSCDQKMHSIRGIIPQHLRTSRRTNTHHHFLSVSVIAGPPVGRRKLTWRCDCHSNFWGVDRQTDRMEDNLINFYVITGPLHTNCGPSEGCGAGGEDAEASASHQGGDYRDFDETFRGHRIGNDNS